MLKFVLFECFSFRYQLSLEVFVNELNINYDNLVLVLFIFCKTNFCFVKAKQFMKLAIVSNVR